MGLRDKLADQLQPCQAVCSRSSGTTMGGCLTAWRANPPCSLKVAFWLRSWWHACHESVEAAARTEGNSIMPTPNPVIWFLFSCGIIPLIRPSAARKSPSTFTGLWSIPNTNPFSLAFPQLYKAYRHGSR